MKDNIKLKKYYKNFIDILNKNDQLIEKQVQLKKILISIKKKNK